MTESNSRNGIELERVHCSSLHTTFDSYKSSRVVTKTVETPPAPSLPKDNTKNEKHHFSQ